MAIDYSKKGKGNDRKIVDVINKYTFNTRGRIIENPWDSDVDYLFSTTVKFRGRVNATVSGPLHETVKNGDMYINTANGSVVFDSDWRNLRGEDVTTGQAFIFYDSEWSILGGGEPQKPDSDNINQVTTIYDFLDEKNRKQNNWYYAGKSDIAFFSPDSDQIFMIDGSSVYKDLDVLLEAYVKTGTTNTIRMAFTGTGVKTQGTLKYIPIDGTASSFSFGAISGATIVNIVSNNNITIRVNDSENQRVEITTNRVPVKGDRLVYTSARGENSVLFTPDGIYFKRMPKVRIDLDSEVHDRKAADSDIIFGRYHTIKVSKTEQRVANSSSTTVNYNTTTKTWSATAGTSGWILDSTNQRIILLNAGVVIDVFERATNSTEIVHNYTTYRRVANLGNTVGTATIQTNGGSAVTGQIYPFEYATPTTSGSYKQLVIAKDSELTLKKFTQVTADTLEHLVKFTNYQDSELNKRLSVIETNQNLDYVRYNKDSDIEVRGIYFTNDSDGYLRWNPTRHTLDLNVDVVSSTTVSLGQEVLAYVKNRDSVTLTRGMVVRVDGASGTELVVRRASNDSEGGSSTSFGVVVQQTNSNANGFVTFVGTVDNINTSAFNEGDALWLGVNGAITNVKPLTPAHLVFVGWCVRKHASSGSIYVKINNGWELEELHDVLYSDPGVGKRHNQVLAYDSDAGYWKNTSINTDFGTF